MQQLNAIGARLSQIAGVHAMTDVTGFGLLGHLVELCEGSGLQAELDVPSVPLLSGERLRYYHSLGCVPGGSKRNWASYGHHVANIGGFERDVLCDPQTSGGLLLSVCPGYAAEVETILKEAGLPVHPIGSLSAHDGGRYISL
jgi:selenide,water dikinase